MNIVNDSLLRIFMTDLNDLLISNEKAIREGLEEKNYYRCYYLCVEVVKNINITYNILKNDWGISTADKFLAKHLSKGTRLKNALQNLINCSPDE